MMLPIWVWRLSGSIHPMGRGVDLVVPNAVRPDHAQMTVPGPAPKCGAHTRELLTEIGFKAAEIAEMVLKGIAGERWSEKYLPE